MHPLWVKLVENGSTVTGYESADGANWRTVGSATVSLNAIALAGLAVTSEYSYPLVTASLVHVTVSTLVDDSSTAIAYSAGWGTTSDASYIDGSAHFAIVPGSTVSFTFVGSSVSWFGSTGQNHGMVDVYIDGVLVQASVDTYSSTATYGRLFSISGLGYGQHTIELVVSSNQNADSTGTFVDVDGFLYS
jgi:bacillopeptidase F